MLLQPLLNAPAKHSRNMWQKHGLGRYCSRQRVLEDFLKFSYHPALAELNTGKKESSHGTGMSTSPAVLKSGSLKLLSTLIAGKIILYNSDRQELADSLPH